ncbi:DUF1778 domain-containing protein [Moraxella nasovis]|nr:DUF1778 domain-containing protein [Moraxella nasovis]UNU72815.1 DUF1778 domain-containing protein [Moraxella nasovis]
MNKNDNEQVWYIKDNDIELIKHLLDNPPKANDELKKLLTLSHDVADLT